MKTIQITTTHRVIGWMGSLLIVIAYLLLTLELFDSSDLAYNAMNLVGALLLGYRVYLDKNWANLFLEFFFGAVAILALAKIIL